MFRPAEKLNEDNRGFTLIELLVGILVASLVLAALAGLVATTMNMFLRGSEETAVQDNARTVLNYAGQKVMEADSEPLRVNSGSLVAYVMDTSLRDGTRGVTALVLDNDRDRLYTATLTADEIGDGSGTAGEGTLSEQVTGDELERIVEEPERYYLADDVTGLSMTRTEGTSLVHVSVSVTSGERSRTVNGRFGMRNYVETAA